MFGLIRPLYPLFVIREKKRANIPFELYMKSMYMWLLLSPQNVCKRKMEFLITSK